MKNYFSRYAQGYIDQDFTKIEEYFAYPCILTNECGTDLICAAADLERHIAGFLAQLKVGGLAQALPTILHDRLYGQKGRVVSVNWKLKNADGQRLVDANFLYVLIDDEGAWKISLVNLL